MKPWFICTILMVLLTAPAWGQTPEAYYHAGAQQYIDGDVQQALQSIAAGLRLDASHPKLRALLEKIQEEQQQQQEQEQQQQQQQDQQNQDQQNQEQKDREQSENNEQQNQQDEQQSEDQPEENQEDQPSPQDSEEPRQEDQPPKPQPQEQEEKELSREEAERILQAMRSKEEENKALKRPKKVSKRKVKKDW